MGSPPTEKGRDRNESEPTPGAVTRPFLIGGNEVTVGEFNEFLTDQPAARVEADSHQYLHTFDDDLQSNVQLPVTFVSWRAAARYCNWLSEQEGLPPAYEIKDDTINLTEPFAGGYRLPTEIEWEYAARAGTETAFSFGDDWRAAGPFTRIFGEFKAYRGLMRFAPLPVGDHQPNPWGLYDLHGNVAEWTQDAYAITALPSTDAAVQSTGPIRSVRGGSGADAMWYRRSASRKGLADNFSSPAVGFRVMRNLELRE